MTTSLTAQVIVVGAGQAGLATSRELTQAGLDHLVLEAGSRAWPRARPRSGGAAGFPQMDRELAKRKALALRRGDHDVLAPFARKILSDDLRIAGNARMAQGEGRSVAGYHILHRLTDSMTQCPAGMKNAAKNLLRKGNTCSEAQERALVWTPRFVLHSEAIEYRVFRGRRRAYAEIIQVDHVCIPVAFSNVVIGFADSRWSLAAWVPNRNSARRSRPSPLHH